MELFCRAVLGADQSRVEYQDPETGNGFIKLLLCIR